MFETIKKVLVSSLNLEAEHIQPDSRLNEDLDIDSLAAVELAMELENEFGIQIEDEELVKLKTVQDIVDLMNQKK